MKLFLQIWAALWIIGGAWQLWGRPPEIFQWLGLSDMSVFNAQAMDSMDFRFIYTRHDGTQTLLLPFISEAGEPLDWFRNEDFKYRTFFPLAVRANSALRDIETVNWGVFWKENQRYLLRPALFDFCRSDRNEQEYRIQIVYSGKPMVNLNFQLKKENIAGRMHSKCQSVRERSQGVFRLAGEVRKLEMREQKNETDSPTASQTVELDYSAF